MIGTITNTDGEITTFEAEDLPKDTQTSGYLEVEGADKDNYFVPDVEEKIKEALKAREYYPKNRKERRALQKKMGKKGYNEFMTIAETARKLDYIDLIQKLRELNEKKKNEGEINNEDSEEND